MNIFFDRETPAYLENLVTIDSNLTSPFSDFPSFYHAVSCVLMYAMQIYSFFPSKIANPCGFPCRLWLIHQFFFSFWAILMNLPMSAWLLNINVCHSSLLFSGYYCQIWINYGILSLVREANFSLIQRAKIHSSYYYQWYGHNFIISLEVILAGFLLLAPFKSVRRPMSSINCSESKLDFRWNKK